MKKGFTLIELMIAMGILVILLALSVTVFSRFVNHERREISERSLQEDIRFALGLFMREARTAYASTYVNTDDGGIVFQNQNGRCVKYRRSTQNSWERSDITTSGTCDSNTVFTNFDSLTSSTTKITRLDFKMPPDVSVTPGVLSRQGFVTVVITAASATSAIPALELQTTVTARQVKASYGT